MQESYIRVGNSTVRSLAEKTVEKIEPLLKAYVEKVNSGALEEHNRKRKILFWLRPKTLEEFKLWIDKSTSEYLIIYSWRDRYLNAAKEILSAAEKGPGTNIFYLTLDEWKIINYGDK